MLGSDSAKRTGWKWSQKHQTEENTSRRVEGET